jgi:hypothetical protein
MPVEPKALDVTNYYYVTRTLDKKVPAIQIRNTPTGLIPPDRALLLAAHIVRCADPDGKLFDKILKAVRET